MPLRGVLSPTTNQPIPLAQVPPEILSPEIVLALTQPDRTGYGISDLTVCPRKKTRETLLDFYLPVEHAYRLIRGKAWDALCEVYPRPGAIYQAEYKRELLGVELKGHPDLLDPGLRTIEDYKAPSKNSRGVAYPSYCTQLNGYVWLSEPYRDWKVEGLFLNTVGPTKFERIPVYVWDTPVTEGLLVASLQTLIDLRAAGDTRLCDREDCPFCRQPVLWME